MALESGTESKTYKNGTDESFNFEDNELSKQLKRAQILKMRMQQDTSDDPMISDTIELTSCNFFSHKNSTHFLQTIYQSPATFLAAFRDFDLKFEGA